MGLLDKIGSAVRGAVHSAEGTVESIAAKVAETVKQAEQQVRELSGFDSKPPPTLPSAPPAAPTGAPTFKPSELQTPAASPTQRSPLDFNLDGGKRTAIIDDPTLGRDLPALLKEKKFTALGAVSPEVAAFARKALGEFHEKYPGAAAKQVAENKSGVIYFKDSKGQTYAAVLERHQHKNATEYGGPGKNGALLKPHNGVTIYKVSEQHPLAPAEP